MRRFSCLHWIDGWCVRLHGFHGSSNSDAVRYVPRPNKCGLVFVLADPADGKDLAVHDDEDARREQARGKQALGKVLQSVAALKAQGRHGPGQDDRNFKAGKGGRGSCRRRPFKKQPGLNHGVGAMRDDDGGAFGGKLGHAIPDLGAIGVGHLEDVFVHQVDGADFGVGQAEQRADSDPAWQRDSPLRHSARSRPSRWFHLSRANRCAASWAILPCEDSIYHRYMRIALLVPDPGGADDVVERGVARLPAQFADGFCGAGDEHGGIAWAAGMNLRRDGMAGDAARRLDDVPNAETLPVTKVIDERRLISGARIILGPELGQRAREGALRRGRRHGCSRGCRCRRGWDNRRRRCGSRDGGRARRREPAGIRWVSGSCASPRVMPSGPRGAPATLK